MAGKDLLVKVEAKGSVAAEQTSIIEKKSSTLYRLKNKDTSKASQESAKPHLSHAQRKTNVNFSLEKTGTEDPA